MLTSKATSLNLVSTQNFSKPGCGNQPWKTKPSSRGTSFVAFRSMGSQYSDPCDARLTILPAITDHSPARFSKTLLSPSRPAQADLSLITGNETGPRWRTKRFAALSTESAEDRKSSEPRRSHRCTSGESISGNLRLYKRQASRFIRALKQMKTAKLEISRLRSMELKYCERCGNIWLRRSGTSRTRCAPCARAEASLLRGGSFLQLWSRLRAGVQA